MIRPAITWVALLAMLLVSNYSAAQSDPSLFNTVINVPPNTAPPQIGSNTQLNLKPGGVLNSITGGPNSIFDVGVRGAANVNVEMNISGGTGAGIYANAGSTVNMSVGDIYLGPALGFALRADNGSHLNMTGGRLLSRVGAFTGSSLNLSGGSVFSFLAEAGSTVRKSGGTIVRELIALPGSSVELVGDEFELDGVPYTNPTITLTDGTSVFTGTLADGTPFILTPLIVDRLSNVTLTQFPVAPANLTPIVVTSATPAPPAGLLTGQSLMLGSGKLRDGFQAYSAQMTINGGDMGFASRVVDSRVDFNGGRVAQDFAAFGGSFVNVAGGEVGPGFLTEGSTVNLTSGKIDDNFFLLHGSTATVTGGTVGRFVAVENSTLHISNGIIASGLRALTGSVVNLSGGRIGDNSSAGAGSVFNITGGEIATNFTMDVGSTVNISGGRLLGNSSGFGGEVRNQGGDVNVSGTAKLGRTVISSSVGRVNVFGGTIGESLQVNGTLNISGGAVGAGLEVPQFGVVNLNLTQATVNGSPIVGPLGVPIEVLERDNAVVGGTLLDGAALEFRMNSATGNAFFNPGATLTVTLVPEPPTLLLAAALLGAPFSRLGATRLRRRVSPRRELPRVCNLQPSGVLMMVNSRPLLVLVCVFSCAVLAHALPYTATILHPPGFDGGIAYGNSSSAQVGAAYGQVTAGQTHAMLWTSTAESAADLNPAGFTTSYAIGNSLTTQVGYGSGLSTGLNDHALLWNGTSATAIDLHPTGFIQSRARHVFGTVQVGEGRKAGFDHALMWSGAASSVVDLHPFGFSDSQALRASDFHQVGHASRATGTHAMLWNGTAASAVDLNPSWLTDSTAQDISGALQVGFGGAPSTGGYSHALLWNSTAASAIDLNPAGFLNSYGTGVSTAGQVGHGYRDAAPLSLYHALYWNGSAASAIDLHSALTDIDPTFNQSFANDIANDGTIVGYATRSTGGGPVPVLWTPVPEPNATILMPFCAAVFSRLRTRVSPRRDWHLVTATSHTFPSHRSKTTDTSRRSIPRSAHSP